MYRRSARSLGLLSLLVVLAVACGGPAAPTAKPAPAPAAPPAQPTAPAKPAAAPASGAAPAAQAYRPTPLSPAVKLRAGTVVSTSDAGIFIGMDKGYFQEEGIELDTQTFQTGVAQIAPLGAGQLDIATGAIAAGLFNAIGRDVPLRVVADKGSTPSPEWDFNALTVRKDLIDSGRVRDYPDLKGLTIATTSKGNSTEVDVAKALEKGGLTWDDIEYTPLSFPDMITAFGNRAIDAAIVIEPYISRIENLGIAVRWRGTTEFYGNQQVAVIMYGPAFVAEQPEVARRWMIAYIRGVRAYNDAFGPKRQGRDEAVQILVKHTPIKDTADYERMRPAGLDPDGKVNLDSMRQDLAYYERAGLVSVPVDLAKVVDTSFQEYAVQRLGPYQR
jgi:NitT/TauT family transport system substrate-binding protein